MRIGIVPVAVVIACASPSGNQVTAPTGLCPRLSGTYTVVFTARSGDCGAVPAQTVTFDPTTTMNPLGQCAGGSMVSVDGCTISYDTTCPAASGTVREAGVAHTSTSGLTATAVEQITLSDELGNVTCSGSYDLSYTRL